MRAALGGAAVGLSVTFIMLVILGVLSCFLKDGPWREGDYVPSSQWFADTHPLVLVGAFLCVLVLIPGIVVIRVLHLEPTLFLVLAIGFTCNALIGSLAGLTARCTNLAEQKPHDLHSATTTTKASGEDETST